MPLFSNNFINIVVSTTAIYLFILIGLRIFGKKELSQLSVVDLVFILLISNAVQNAMVGPDSKLLGGIIAAGTLFVVNFLLKLLVYWFPSANKLLQGEAVLLIYQGKLMRKNIQKALFTQEEIEEVIREHGVSSVEEVDLAVLEIDGNISVISDNYRKKTTKKRSPRRILGRKPTGQN